MIKDLKPCPFCGGAPEVDAMDRLIVIECKPCGYRRGFDGLLSIQPSPVKVSETEFYHQHAHEEAAAEWNQRASAA